MQVANLDALADSHGSNVDVEMLRNSLVFRCNVDLADREVHTATIAHTLCQTIELDRDAHSDRLLVVNLVEVNVKEGVCYRMELKLLENRCTLLAVDDELDNVDVWSVDDLSQLAHRTSD